jgi:hypothetical protein
MGTDGRALKGPSRKVIETRARRLLTAHREHKAVIPTCGGHTKNARLHVRVASATLQSAFSLEQGEQENDNGDHKNNVDEAPGNVKADAEQPQNHKDDKESPEHIALNFPNRSSIRTRLELPVLLIVWRVNGNVTKGLGRAIHPMFACAISMEFP